MIHKKSQHLLPQIYSGRMAEDDYVAAYEEARKPGLAVAAAAATGGLAFKAIEESDLQQSREAYLREQEAWETGSISTAMGGGDTSIPMYRGDSSQAFFEAKKREYMESGPSRPGTPGTLELSRIPSGGGQGIAGDSQENLLYGAGNNAGRGTAAAAYGRQMAGPGQMYHGGYQQAAMSSFDDVGMAYGANRSGYFEDPQSNYAGRGAAAPQYGRASPSLGQYPPSYQYPPLPSGAGAPLPPGASPPQPYGAQFGSGRRSPGPEVGYHRSSPSQQYEQQYQQPQQGSPGHRMYPSSGSSQDLYGQGRYYGR